MDGADQSLDREALIALLVELRRELLVLREENASLRRRVEELEGRGGKRRKKVEQAYSMRAEEQRQKAATEGERGDCPIGGDGSEADLHADGGRAGQSGLCSVSSGGIVR